MRLRCCLPLGAVLALLGAEVPKDPPRLRVEPSGQVDLGSLGPRERREQAYRFRNVSPSPIRLRVLDLSPGVTVQGPALKEPLAPGGSADLVLTLDPEGWEGFQTRNVRLETDDPRQGHYYLPVKARIRPDLTVDAPRKDFGDVAAHESPRVAFRFTRETGEPVALRLPAGLPPYLEAEILPAPAGTLPAPPGTLLAFTLRPDRVEPGMRMGMECLRVETSAPLQPAFDLYLDWKLHHPVEAEPSRVVFTDPGVFRLELRLEPREAREVRLLRAEVEGGGFEVGPLRQGQGSATLEILRKATAAARATLVLAFAGVDRELRVPLAYLPTTPSRPR
jgi:hypothetical protein